jgi:tetratricopeptide (TPR) repeat protein
VLAALGLAGCATMGNPPASDTETPLNSTSQSNLTSLGEVIDKHPDDPQAYNMRGSVYGEAGRNEEALADFDKAIVLDGNYAQAYANRALIYRKTNRFDLALADDNKALAIDANYVPAYLGRGIVYREQGRSSQALADFNKAIALRPDNAEAYYNRGLLYQSQGQHAFAVDDFSTAIALTGQKPEPYVARALSYLAIGNDKPPAPMPRRSILMINMNRRKPALPASAARSGRSIRRFSTSIRSFPRKRESRRDFSYWVPAFAGTSGARINPDRRRESGRPHRTRRWRRGLRGHRRGSARCASVCWRARTDARPSHRERSGRARRAGSEAVR